MTGIILCGGQSTRMGSDKGLLKAEGGSWTLTAAEKLLSLGIPVCISVNLAQRKIYSDAFPNFEFITDNAALLVKGPLLGLLSAHIALPTEDLFILPCDMPQIDSSLLKELYTKHMQTSADAFLFTNEGEAEPLCAIYTVTGLQKVVDMLQTGALKKFSMKFVLDHLKIFTIALEPFQKKYFQNINTHADLNGL